MADNDDGAIRDEIDDERGDSEDGRSDAGAGQGQEDGREESEDDTPDFEEELKTLRRENRKLKRENARRRVAEKQRDDTGEGAESARELETVRQQADLWRGDAIAARAEARLVAAGADPERVGRLIRMIDVKDLEIDPGSRKVEGLDEQIDELKEDYPELFRREEPRRRPRLTTGERRTSDGGTRGGLSVTSRRMLGR